MLTPDQPRSVRPGEELDIPALNAFLIEQAPQLGRVLAVRQFPGGFSNLTYALTTSNGEYVLRRPPFGVTAKGGHDMGREFRVLSLLNGHYAPIPMPVAYCESADVLGAPFYVMERVSGLILRASMAPTLDLPPARMRQLSEALVDNLVTIHALPLEPTGLIQLGKPTGYVQRQVEGWINRYEKSQTDDIPAMNAVADWLSHHYPTEQVPALLHNDYKYDNVLFEADATGAPTPIINGVLDWEMATVGDPLMDVGAMLAYWSEATDSPAHRSFNLTWLPGNLTRQEVVSYYAQRSGRDLSEILFYYVFGLYKNAVIAQQIYARWKQGYSQDTRFGQLLPLITELANRATAALESGAV